MSKEGLSRSPEIKTASKGKSKTKQHIRHFSHTNSHLPSFLTPVSNIWLTATGRIPIHQRPEGKSPLAAVHRQRMVVASQPSSHHSLGLIWAWSSVGSVVVTLAAHPLPCFFPGGVLGLASTPHITVQLWHKPCVSLVLQVVHPVMSSSLF